MLLVHHDIDDRPIFCCIADFRGFFSFHHSLEMLYFDNRDTRDNTYYRYIYIYILKKTGFGSGVVLSELLCKGTLLLLKAFPCSTRTTEVPVNNVMAGDLSESNFHFWHVFSAMQVGSSVVFNLCDRGQSLWTRALGPPGRAGRLNRCTVRGCIEGGGPQFPVKLYIYI